MSKTVALTAQSQHSPISVNGSDTTQSQHGLSTVLPVLGTCEVCACKDAKYTCPKCEVKTCCIACANIHKKELSCSGVRDKVNFKQLSKFTNMDLQSGR
uniref:HIT-type domain-containing protein n=1 Tax=Timema douglasi TaxID=61478 RepID=A0A7R8W1M1_TIMDO|nr:unnamed protein product [Timema douglasi]